MKKKLKHMQDKMRRLNIHPTESVKRMEQGTKIRDNS